LTIGLPSCGARRYAPWRSFYQTGKPVKGGESGSAASRRRSDRCARRLTRREIAVLKRLESGLSNKEIAEAVVIRAGKLKWQRHNVCGKLGVKNRSGANIKASVAGGL
jgi:DNA-binding NarL/FixJ family response regulator